MTNNLNQDHNVLPQKQNITFNPNQTLNDVYLRYWLRQVNLRLRREIYWCWYERNLISKDHDSSNTSNILTLPPFSNPTFEILNKTRNWEKKNNYFKTNKTANYLTKQIQKSILHTSDSSTLIRGSLSWLAKELDLDDLSLFVIAFGLAISYDSDIGSVISACLNDPSQKQPNITLIQKLWDHPEQITTLYDPSHPLYSYGFIKYSQFENNGVFIDWDTKIQISPILCKQLLDPHSEIPKFLRLIDIDTEKDSEFIITDESTVVASRLMYGNDDTLKIVPILGNIYSLYHDVVKGLKKLTNRTIVEFIGDPKILNPDTLNSIVTLCWLRNYDLFLDKDVVSYLFTNRQNINLNFIPSISIPITIFLGIVDDTQLDGIPKNLLLPTIRVPKLSYFERVAFWKKNLGDQSQGLNATISEISSRFRYEKKIHY